MAYEIKSLSIDPKSIKGISEKVIVSHYENNYGGAESGSTRSRSNSATSTSPRHQCSRSTG